MEDIKNPIELIEDWRTTFGLPVLKKYIPLKAVGTSKREEIALGFKLMQEELGETIFAAITEDDAEFKDGIIDMLFILIQIANTSGVDIQEFTQRVYDANMSKLCPDLACANDTIDKYRKEGIAAYSELTSGGRFIIKRKSDGKVLKGINFKKPEF